MDKKTGIILAVVALLVVVGIAVYANQVGFAPATTDTTSDTNSNTNTTTGVTPGAATVVTSSNVGTTDATAIVTGTVKPNGVVTSYWYEYGLTSSLGSKTATQVVGSGYATLSAPGYITGLSRDSTYYFRLVAENQYGRTSGATQTLLTTHSTPAPQGSTPSVNTANASGITKNTATVSGQVIPNGASTQFWFEYGTTQSFGNTTNLQSVGNGTASVPASATISNLNPLTTYYYRINAQNQFGTINGTILTFKTSGPATTLAPAVETNAATGVSNTSATLHGGLNPNGDATTYWFEYSTDSLLGSVLLKTTSKTSAGSGTDKKSVSANISGLARGTTYYARLVAQNSQGVVRGDKVTFKTK